MSDDGSSRYLKIESTCSFKEKIEACLYLISLLVLRHHTIKLAPYCTDDRLLLTDNLKVT